ncbi:BCCT family transporter [Virgibacillus dakarensis]|uniref:Glycine/betaine ABC transporter n=1 Tax=Lentibacillus populi TaxID=1827502 RepID=A0A9W5TZ91_9BACI|nr:MULTISPECIES: BCCT family transporter [Bacillaceae]MBT2215603.1 BCCT family transporter [Virgibacillus dakarensis]MTW85230.1 BCCT family transporter [Virgibacillus dakarensis]GGB48554.1 glycine/betaine ABC transporter [Lentibacillus populi]
MKKVTRVFYITLVLVILAVILGALFPGQFEKITGNIKAFVATSFGWYYMLLMSAMIILSIIIAISPYGKIRLGKDKERPDFSTPTWIAMLFSAGMGIGLVFYGAAEPLFNYALDAATEKVGTDAAFKEGLSYSYFHWGVHIWAMYGIVALALAFFQFRKEEPGLISATLKPLFGEKMNGPLGVLIDVLAVFATVFGVATSLGFGAAQINGGLSHLFGVEVSFFSQFIIILIVTILFIASAWSGLSKGIKYLSNTNMVLAVLLLVVVIIVGPTLLILDMFTETFGQYMQNLIEMSFRTAPLEGDNRAWHNNWTIFFWAWWISWAPFVGMFIARVSKGRTIRQFLLGVMVAPTLFVSIWFAAFGTTAGDVQNSGTDLTNYATELVLFNMFDQMPLSFILSIIAILLIASFFITSADSATFVLGIQSTNGSLIPPNQVKIIWGIAQSAVALILLYVGGLTAIQNTIIIAALPFSFVMILMVIALFKALSKEVK